MEENNVILNKIETIERCINRINIVYENNPENLKDFYDYIDAVKQYL